MASPATVVRDAYLARLRASPPGRPFTLPRDLQRLLAAHDEARVEAEAIFATERQATPAKPRRRPAAFRPMTEAERELASRLVGCSFSIGSFDKRFARDLAGQARQVEPVITDKQAALALKLAHRYRRQLGGCPVEACSECAEARR